MLRKKTVVILYTALCVGGFACKKETRIEKVDNPGYYSRVTNIVNDNAGLSLFKDYLNRDKNQLSDMLLQPGPFTVMAPDNSAFLILIRNFYGYDTAASRSYVSMPYCIVNGLASLKQLPIGQNQELTTITGNKLWVSKWLTGSDTVIGVNGAKVSVADAPASNGLINVLNRVYASYGGDDCMAAVNSQYNLSYFAAALQRSHWDDSLRKGGPYTVLAPDNTAFINRGFATMDSVLRTNPDTLAVLLKGHILPQRKFLLDVEMDRTTTDTIRYTALTGNVVRAVLIPDTRLTILDARAKRIVFLGKKESYSAPTRTAFYNYTWPCGNGVVLTIDKVLIQ